MRATWEAFIQHYNVCLTLLRSNEILIPYVKDLAKEMKECLEALGMTTEQFQTGANYRS